MDDSIEEKLNKIVQKVYGGAGVELAPSAKKELKELERLGFGNYPICMAKPNTHFQMMRHYLERQKILL